MPNDRGKYAAQFPADQYDYVNRPDTGWSYVKKESPMPSDDQDAGMTARDDAQQIIGKAIRYAVLMGYAGVNPLREAEKALTALAEAGLCIVERDDIELAVEWMDQTDNPWSGAAYQETWADSLVMRDQLKDVLAESYAAVAPGAEDAR